MKVHQFGEEQRKRKKRLSRQVPSVHGIGGPKGTGHKHGKIRHLHVNFFPPGDRHQPRHRLPLGLFHLHEQVLVQSARAWCHRYLPPRTSTAVANVSPNDCARQDGTTQRLAGETQRRAWARGGVGGKGGHASSTKDGHLLPFGFLLLRLELDRQRALCPLIAIEFAQ